MWGFESPLSHHAFFKKGPHAADRWDADAADQSMNYARQSFLSRLRREVLLLDGAMGTMLQARGLPPGEPPEAFLLARPEATREIHRAYVEAGSDVVITATFGASPLRLADHGLAGRCREINRLAVRVAREASRPGTLVAAGLGPCGKLIAPLGEASFEEVRANYEQQAAALASMDPDLDRKSVV